MGSTGFEPVTSVMPLQCSIMTELISWDEVSLLGSCIPVKGPGEFNKCIDLKCGLSTKDKSDLHSYLDNLCNCLS